MRSANLNMASRSIWPISEGNRVEVTMSLWAFHQPLSPDDCRASSMMSGRIRPHIDLRPSFHKKRAFRIDLLEFLTDCGEIRNREGPRIFTQDVFSSGLAVIIKVLRGQHHAG